MKIIKMSQSWFLATTTPDWNVIYIFLTNLLNVIIYVPIGIQFRKWFNFDSDHFEVFAICGNRTTKNNQLKAFYVCMCVYIILRKLLNWS